MVSTPREEQQQQAWDVSHGRVKRRAQHRVLGTGSEDSGRRVGSCAL